MHSLLRERVNKTEFAGVKQQAVFTGEFGCIQSVADDGVTDSQHMYPQLVTAPGQRV